MRRPNLRGKIHRISSSCSSLWYSPLDSCLCSSSSTRDWSAWVNPPLKKNHSIMMPIAVVPGPLGLSSASNLSGASFSLKKHVTLPLFSQLLHICTGCPLLSHQGRRRALHNWWRLITPTLQTSRLSHRCQLHGHLLHPRYFPGSIQNRLIREQLRRMLQILRFGSLRRHGICGSHRQSILPRFQILRILHAFEHAAQ